MMILAERTTSEMATIATNIKLNGIGRRSGYSYMNENAIIMNIIRAARGKETR